MGKLGRLRAVRWFSIASMAVSSFALGNGDARAAGPDKPAASPGPAAATQGAGDAARAHAKRGDCAGALDAFDQAARLTIDPTVRRDRGLCHEQLGHPYPAIDDYRYYLTLRPDAPDAEDIRGRLARLEQEVGQGGERGQDGAGQNKPERSTKSSKSSAGVSLSLNGANASGEGGSGRNLDTIERDESLDTAADESPLRRGTGLELGVALEGGRYTKEAFGWTELVALELRYSLSQVSTLLLELGVTHVNSTGNASSLGGGEVAAGYEARIPLNPRLDDALLLGALFGYEHLAQPSNGAVFAGFFPKVRFGYRHVIGPALGLEAAADGGLAILHLTGAPAGVDATQNSPIIGLHLGLIVGF